MDLYSTVRQKGLDDPVQYWQDIALLTDKFEPFESFATEQGIFELKQSWLQEQFAELSRSLEESDIAT